MPIYFQDLIQYRELGNKIGSQLAGGYVSPQLIIFKGGQSVYNVSHNMIQSSEFARHI